VLGCKTPTTGDLDPDTFIVRLHMHDDMLDQQANDLFALSGRRLCSMPELGNVPGESHDLGSFVVGELPRLILQEAIVFLLVRSLRPQCLFPALLERAGYQTILGLDGVILPFGAMRRLGRPFQPQLPLPVQAFPFLVNLELRAQA
jgi:hypothetical protein